MNYLVVIHSLSLAIDPHLQIIIPAENEAGGPAAGRALQWQWRDFVGPRPTGDAAVQGAFGAANSEMEISQVIYVYILYIYYVYTLYMYTVYIYNIYRYMYIYSCIEINIKLYIERYTYTHMYMCTTIPTNIHI